MKLTYLIEVLMDLYYAKRYRYYYMEKQDAQKNKIFLTAYFNSYGKGLFFPKMAIYESVNMEYDLL